MGGNIGGFGMTIGGSHSASQMQEQFNKNFNYLKTEVTFCELYTTEFDYYMFNGFSEAFKRGVLTLTEEYDEARYMAFYNEFGTHWIFRASFGSAVYENYVLEESFVAMQAQ